MTWEERNAYAPVSRGRSLSHRRPEIPWSWSMAQRRPVWRAMLDIVCADLEEARLAHCQGTPRLAPALLLAWRAGYALGAPGSLPPRHPCLRPGKPRPSPLSIGTGRASQPPGGPVLVGGTAGQPCVEV